MDHKKANGEIKIPDENTDLLEESDISNEIVLTVPDNIQIQNGNLNLLEETEMSEEKKRDQKIHSLEAELARIVGEEIQDESKETNETIETIASNDVKNIAEVNVAIVKEKELQMDCNEDSEHISNADLDEVEIRRENSIDHEEIEYYEISDDNQPVKKNTVNSDQSERDSDNTDFEEDYFPIIQNDVTDVSFGENHNKNQENGDSVSKQNSNNPDNDFAVNDSDNDCQYDITKLVDVKEVRNLHRCSICQYTTPHMNVLSRHIMTVHNSKTTWKCKHCYKEFGAKISVESHIRKEHSKKLRKCPYCTYKLFCYGKVMKKHITRVHGSKNIKTKILRRSTLRKTYDCKICFFSDKSLEKLESHMEMHNLKHVLRCMYCYYMTNNQELYKLHLGNKHKMAKKIFICSKCFFQSEDEGEYNSHMKRPHERHHCSVCDYTTIYIEILYNHLKKHKTKKHVHKELCTKCNYIASSNNDLKNHFMAQHEYNNSGDEISIKSENLSANEIYVKGDDDENLIKRILGDEGNNIEIEEFDETYSKFRERPQSEIFDLYTIMDEEGVSVPSQLFTCLKCDFKSPVKRYMHKHVARMHLGDSQKRKENFKKDVKTQIHEDQSRTRFIIENSTSAKGNSHLKNGYSVKCDECNFTTPTVKSLIIHKDQKHNIINLNCTSCGYKAVDNTNLLVHLEKCPVRESEMLICPFCDFENDDQIGINTHVNIEHFDILQKGLREDVQDEGSNTISYEVVEEAKEADERANQAFVIRKNNFGKTYHCKLCSYDSEKLSCMQTHLQDDHIERYLVCPRCSQKQSTDIQKFWDHLNQHCPQCPFQSDDCDRLKSHMLSHVPRYKRSFSKSVKKSSFLAKKRLDNCNWNCMSDNYRVEPDIDASSKYTEDNDESDDEKCAPTTNGEITIIIDASESDNSRFRSELDNFPNKKKNRDGRSEFLNTEEIRIIFDDCFENHPDDINKEDSVELDLSEEFRQILEEYSEDSCSENQEDILENSKSEMTDEYSPYKPIKIIKLHEYQCFDCLNVYKNRCSLMEHRKRVHTLKKPHSCTYCMEVFKSYSHLKSHYYRVHQASYHHHKGPIFKCPLCDFTCIYLKQMKKHVMKSHKRNAVGFKR